MHSTVCFIRCSFVVQISSTLGVFFLIRGSIRGKGEEAGSLKQIALCRFSQ